MTLTEKAMQEEKIRLKNVIDPLIQGTRRTTTTGVLTSDDLNRAKARKQDWQDMQEILANGNIHSLAAVSQNIHEDHRLRRDMYIALAGHKQLMLSAINTAYKRIKELEYQVERLHRQK